MTTQAHHDALAARLAREQPDAWAVWMEASSAWGRHVLACDACPRGRACSVERELTRRVVETAAFMREAGG